MKRNGYRYRRPKNDLGYLQDKDAKLIGWQTEANQVIFRRS